jgi:hypothetical protein
VSYRLALRRNECRDQDHFAHPPSAELSGDTRNGHTGQRMAYQNHVIEPRGIHISDD